MRAEDERFAQLRELGITEYGARTYLTLLELGASEARVLSDVSKVPQSKIYAVLEDLAAVGLVRIHPDHPKKYSAGELAPYLDERAERFHRESQKIVLRRDDIVAMFRASEATPNVASGSALQIRGRAAILRHVAAMVGEAQRDLLVLGVQATPARYASLREDLERAHARGVSLRCLFPVSAHTIEPARELARIAEVRVRTDDRQAAEHVAMVVSDDRSALIIHWASIHGQDTGRDTALATDDPAIATALRHLIETAWPASIPLDQAVARLN